MNEIILSLGCNLGNREENIHAMIDLVHGVLVGPYKMSPIMETEPVHVAGPQPWYYNMILSGFHIGRVECLLEACEAIERRLGREKKSTKEPRTADIDLLLAGSIVKSSQSLTIPHPSILLRRFCIEGIYSIAPEFVHPVVNMTFASLFASMDESVKQQKINYPF